MSVYIVTYDLHKDATPFDYERLLKLIKEEGSWACLGSSSYLVESEQSARQLRDHYKEVLVEEDMLYVGMVEATAAWHGYSKEVSDWIINKLK